MTIDVNDDDASNLKERRHILDRHGCAQLTRVLPKINKIDFSKMDDTSDDAEEVLSNTEHRSIQTVRERWRQMHDKKKKLNTIHSHRLPWRETP